VRDWDLFQSFTGRYPIFGYFWDRVLHLCPAYLDCDLSVYVSCVVAMIGICHCIQIILVKIGFHELFVHTGLKLQSSQSQLPESLGLQAWASMPYYKWTFSMSDTVFPKGDILHATGLTSIWSVAFRVQCLWRQSSVPDFSLCGSFDNLREIHALSGFSFQKVKDDIDINDVQNFYYLRKQWSL
jgi:hypothetical protein